MPKKNNWSWDWIRRRSFERTNGDTTEFWDIRLLCVGIQIWNGKLGETKPDKQIIISNSTTEAIDTYLQMIDERLAENFVEGTSAPSSTTTPLKERVEQFIAKLVQDPDSASAILSEEAIERDNIAFWVDWKEEDVWIIQACEEILETGQLAGELVSKNTDHGYEVYIRYRDKRAKVPLKYSEEDGHVVICALNKILAPDYEVRYCIDSDGDGCAFLPLSATDWAALEKQFGREIEKHFYKVKPKPNLFCDAISFIDDGKKMKVTTEAVRKVAVALRDLQVGDVISEDDFKIRSVAISTAPKDAMLAIVGAQLTTPITKGSIIKRSEITNIPGSVASYS